MLLIGAFGSRGNHLFEAPVGSPRDLVRFVREYVLPVLSAYLF
jgi:hypothetical protein